LNHRDRFLAAVSHEEPDRVPIDVWYTPEMIDRLVNEWPLCLQGSPPNRHQQASIALEHDAIKATIGPCSSFYLSDEEYYRDEWGIGWRRVQYASDCYYTEPFDHPLSDEKNLDSFKLPDFAEEQRYTEIQDLLAQYGSEYAIIAEVACTLFELSWYLRGLQRVLMDFVSNKDFMHEYLARLSQWIETAGRKLASMGVDVIFVGDDFGMQDRMLVSPQVFREFFKPTYAELFEEFKRINPDIKIAFHTDGDVEPILPDFVEIGVDILNPVQPQSMDPAHLKKRFGKKLTFWGTLDNQHTVPFGSISEVEKEVLQRLRDVAPGGGLIIGPAHNVQPITPMDNLRTIYSTVLDKGRYPISL